MFNYCCPDRYINVWRCGGLSIYGAYLTGRPIGTIRKERGIHSSTTTQGGAFRGLVVLSMKVSVKCWIGMLACCLRRPLR